MDSVITSSSTPFQSVDDSETQNTKMFSRDQYFARIAVYDDLKAAPRIIDVGPLPVLEFIDALALETYNYAQQLGGRIPYTVIREIAENFIHADFEEPVVSILDGGNTISFADQGPGIADKKKVLVPGFTSATQNMKKYIRGVGSGLPRVKEFLAVSGGRLLIDDNIKNGSVITLTLIADTDIDEYHEKRTSENPYVAADTTSPFASAHSKESQKTVDVTSRSIYRETAAVPSLSQKRIMKREEDVLRLFRQQAMIGPSDLKAPPLCLSLGTAARTLDTLEDAGLIVSTESKKRILTEEGAVYLETLRE